MIGLWLFKKTTNQLQLNSLSSVSETHRSNLNHGHRLKLFSATGKNRNGVNVTMTTVTELDFGLIGKWGLLFNSNYIVSLRQSATMKLKTQNNGSL